MSRQKKLDIDRYDFDAINCDDGAMLIKRFAKDGEFVEYKDHDNIVTGLLTGREKNKTKLNKLLKAVSRNFTRCPNEVTGLPCVIDKNSNLTHEYCTNVLEGRTDAIFECWKIFHLGQKGE